jgi:hypothetical protein
MTKSIQIARTGTLPRTAKPLAKGLVVRFPAATKPVLQPPVESSQYRSGAASILALLDSDRAVDHAVNLDVQSDCVESC